MLTVEDGSGLANGESYVSVVDFKAWATARGYEVSSYGTTDLEKALRRGTSYIDSTFGGLFNGSRLNGRDQALLWPREDATDAEGEEVADDAVPVEVKNATNEASYRELSATLTPDVEAGAKVLKRVKAGDTEVEYAIGGSSVKTYPAIAKALATLIGAGSGGSGYYFGIATPANSTTNPFDL
jgi:hypothetical protein